MPTISNSKKIAIIGAGEIALVHAQAAKRIGVQVTHVYNRTKSKAQLIADLFDDACAVDDLDAIWNCDAIDAVIICLPNAFHKDLSIAAMQAGKDVLIEKPMGLNGSECQEMVDVADKTGQLLQLGVVARFTPIATTAKAFVDAGRLGKIYHAKANYYRRRGIPGLGGWFTTKAESGGGPLIDIGVHVIDLAMHLMGMPNPTRVSGQTFDCFGKQMGDYVYEHMHAGPTKIDGVFDVEDFAHALVRFDNGSTLEINAAWAGNFPDDSVKNLVGIFGDQGGVSFELGGDSVRLATTIDGRNVDVSPQLPQVHERYEFDVQLAAFVESLETRKPNHACYCGTNGEPDGHDCLKVQRIIDAIYASSDAGREIAIEV